jgi:PPOX class probable F420-dependent enzyme
MATLSEKQAKLFTDRNWGVIATIREDGSPQATPVWIDYDGKNVLVNSAHGRTKVTNIERDPRATVTVLPAEDQQSGYVMVSGPATIVEEGAFEHINMLAKKYLGEDKYPYLVDHWLAEPRVDLLLRSCTRRSSVHRGRHAGWLSEPVAVVSRVSRDPSVFMT